MAQLLNLSSKVAFVTEAGSDPGQCLRRGGHAGDRGQESVGLR
jgi:hypothetical protein